MLIEQPARFLRWLYPHAVWRMSPRERAVYLTFDDGPIPEATPYVLDVLDQFGAKATFFMVGDNAHRYPELLAEVRRRGHAVGNHTYNHIGGFRWSTWKYLFNVHKCSELLNTKLFRPPHGWMRAVQYRTMRIFGYKVVMWDLVTRDYSWRLTGEQVLEKVQRYVRNGSIITFHDSLKSEPRLKYALPRSIEWLLAQGYTFKVFEKP